MSGYAELNVSRKKLVEGLGEKSTIYFQQMKMWFQMKCSKEEFDFEARKMMTQEQIHLHNAFLLCLFSRCQSLAGTSSRSNTSSTKSSSTSRDKAKKAKPKKRNRSDKGFERADLWDYLPALSAPPAQAYEEPLRYCYQELFLPDTSLVFGRLMLGAWERELEGAEDTVADYIVVAVQHLLKNLLTAVLARKSGYRLRERRFIHAIGGVVPDPLLRSTIRALNYNAVGGYEHEKDDEGQEIPVKRPTLEDVEQQAAFEIACGCENVKTRITAHHILETLQVHRNIIPSNSVYSSFVEKVINDLNHPSYEEIEASS